MKRTILFLILINVLSIHSFAQDYYFYEGRRIELTKRLDKIAIILNKTNLTKNNIEQTLKTK